MLFKTTRHLMIDLIATDRQRSDGGKYRHHCHQNKHRSHSPVPGRIASQQRSNGITAMVKGFVTAHLPVKPCLTA